MNKLNRFHILLFKYSIFFILSLLVIMLIESGIILSTTQQAKADSFSECLEEPVFSKKYMRDPGAPKTVTDTFSLQDPESIYMLRVENGESGAHRNSSITLKVNGEQMVGPSDINEEISIVEIPLSLSHVNTIEITLEGEEGSCVTIKFYPLSESPGMFGPLFQKTYIREAGEEQIITDQFSGVNPKGEYFIRIESGDDEGQNRVSDAEIILNDELVFTPDDFNQQIQIRELLVSLKDENTLSVSLEGLAGSVMTIKILRCNKPPIFVTEPITTATEDELYEYESHAIDPDEDPLTYILHTFPEGMEIDGGTGRITWTPGFNQSGSHEVVLAVADDSGGEGTQGFTIEVANVFDDTPPRITDIVCDPLILNPGETTTITIEAIDNQGIDAYELKVEGVEIPMVENSATYTAMQTGVHKLVAWVRDYSDNENIKEAAFGVRDPSDTTLPQVCISSPSEDAKLIIPTQIVGTVNDDNLIHYTVEYSEKDKNMFVQFHKGYTPVTENTLATLNTTLLVNGLYDIRLTAFDVNGATASSSVTYRIGGGYKEGVLNLAYKDLEIPVKGVPMNIIRTYDNRRGENGDFGKGWSLSWNTITLYENRPPGEGPWYQEGCGYISDTPHYVYIVLPDGEVLEFTYTFKISELQPVPPPVSPMLLPVLTPEEGTRGTLVPGSLSLTWDNLLYFDGTDIRISGIEEVYDPDYYILTIYGEDYIIDKDEGLIYIVGRENGDGCNELEISPDKISHFEGKEISLTRDEEGRITKITDPLGNEIIYSYNSKGYLTTVTDQEGTTSHYTYHEPTHLIHQIISGEGASVKTFTYDYDGRLYAYTDAEGDTTCFRYDSEGLKKEVEDPLGNVDVFEYNDEGKVVSKTDPLGNITSYTYDSHNNLIAKTDPLGYTTQCTYDGKGNLLTITDPKGDVTTNTYDNSGRLKSTTDPLGYTTSFIYDFCDNIREKTDPLGNVTSYERYCGGNIRKMIDPLGHETIYTYDEYGNLLTKTLHRTTAAGQEAITTSMIYDGLNRLIKTIDPSGNETLVEYTATGRIKAAIDKNGNKREYAYDSSGNLIKTTFPDGTTEKATYDAEGRMISHRDCAGRITQFAYDALGRLTDTIYPDGSASSITYDAAGRVIKRKDERGNSTNYAYDARGNCISICDAAGHITTITYDDNGNTIGITDARGNQTCSVYDSKNQQTAVIFPDGTMTQKIYDARGLVIADKDQAGIPTSYTYDALGRLTSVIDALGNETSFSYDELGNMVATTDANGNTTSFEYDKLSRLTKSILPLGMSETMAYDPLGNLIMRADFNGNITTFVYNSSNRLIEKQYQDGSSLFFTYTPTGRRASVQDWQGVTTYEYDMRDRLCKGTDPDGTLISYTYDVSGNRASVTAASDTTWYEYDALHRLIAVEDPDGDQLYYGYDEAGNLTSIDYPNEIKESLTYNLCNKIIKREYRLDDDGIIACYSYILGPAGNKISAQENNGRELLYTYDMLYRLTDEHIFDPAVGERLISYSYDPVGNRLSKNDTGGEFIQYVYDENDRLVTANGASYTYDNNGNLLQTYDNGQMTTYSYDYENRLIHLQTPTSLCTYGYDADGIRVQSGVDGIVTTYLVDKNRLIPQVIEEQDAGSSLLARYLWGNNLASMRRGWDTSFYIADGSGTVRMLTDHEGSVTDTYTYDTFGILLSTTGETVNNYLYTGGEYDKESGLYYMGAQYYDPEIGGFLTTTPRIPGGIGQSGGRGIGYQYIDPAGGSYISHKAGSGAVSFFTVTAIEYALIASGEGMGSHYGGAYGNGDYYIPLGFSSDTTYVPGGEITRRFLPPSFGMVLGIGIPAWTQTGVGGYGNALGFGAGAGGVAEPIVLGNFTPYYFEDLILSFRLQPQPTPGWSIQDFYNILCFGIYSSTKEGMPFVPVASY
ncbi:MAG: putative Ig domain-containing protein [bacterium]